ncbi:MAG: tRNA (adenosine(37)-N6)-threonylcarbamoyltransferase complex ATPase subunit type 1 TsaE, partial [Ancrocorticia populi]
AYRLTSLDELDALDLDASLEESATVVEWGEGKVEVLTEDRLILTIIRPEGSDEGDEVEDLSVDAPRTVVVKTTGPRSEQLAEQLRDSL